MPKNKYYLKPQATFEFVNPQNICLDTKIMLVSVQVVQIRQPYQIDLDHIFLILLSQNAQFLETFSQICR